MMADTILESPRAQKFEEALSGHTDPEYFPLAEDYSSDGPGSLEIAGALWRQHSLISSTISNAEVSDSVDEDFNPYTTYKANESELQDVTPWIRKGYFDDVFNESQFWNRVSKLRRQQQDLDLVEEGSGFNMVLGGASLLLDPTTLIPLPAIGKGSLLSSVAKGALGVGGVTTVEEAVLQSQQDLRTLKESYLNIGVATALGGGIGALASVFTKGNPLNPSNPSNPLNVENDVPTGIWTPGERATEGESLSAAKTPEDEIIQGDAAPEKLGGTSAVGRVFSRATPVGRSFLYASDAARRNLQKLMDTGGVLRKSNTEGVATDLSAEDYKIDFKGQTVDQVFTHIETKYRDTLEALGQKGAKGPSVNFRTDAETLGLPKSSHNMITQEDFKGIALKKLQKTWSDADEADLIAKYGDDGAKAILSNSEDVAKFIHKTNKYVEDEMVKWGMIDEKQRMGEDYGLAQTWMGQSILQDESQFRAFLFRKLSRDPDEEWLAKTYEGMSLEDFRKLPDDERSMVLESWGADEAYIKLDLAENRAGLAERKVRTRRAALKPYAEALGFTEKELKSTNLKKIKAKIIEKTKAAEANAKLKFARSSDASERRAFAKSAARYAEAMKRVDELASEYAELKAAKDDLKARQAEIEQSVKDAEKEQRSANRALKKERKKAPINEVIDDVIRSVTSGRSTPFSALRDDFADVVESGRAKTRQLKLTPDELRLAQDRGWLPSDLSYSLRKTYSDIGGRLALRKAYGIRKKGGESLEDVWREIEDDYRRLIEASDPETAAKLADEMASAKRDFIGVRNRVLGVHEVPDDPESLIYWGTSKLREWNYTMYGAGFLISSLTDLAMHYMTTGKAPLSKVYRQSYKEWKRLAKEAPEDELRAAIYASEYLMTSARHAKMYNIEDAIRMNGVGEPGTLKHKMTSSADRKMNFLSEKVASVSGMPLWNSVNKGIAGIIQLNNMHKLLGKYDSLSTKEVAQLATLGVGKDEARLLRKYFDKYGEMDGDMFRPNTERWNDTTEGRYAHQLLRVALRRTVDRAVITPGVGDTPLLMSSTIGKLLLQFQSHGFTIVNRYLTPGSQRLMNFKDREAAQSFMMLVSLGGFVTVLRDVLYGRDPADRDINDFLYEALDRSGAMAYMSPYADAAIKSYGSQINEAIGADILPSPSKRYIRLNALQSLLGPSYGTAESIHALSLAASDGDAEKVREKAARLAPFGTLFRIGEGFLKE